MNIVEYIRKEAITKLFGMSTFNNVWEIWRPEILRLTQNPPLAPNVLELGDNLASIFKTTGVIGRSQSTLSGGGAGWEALVCWYLNICLIGTRTVVIKQDKKLIPDPLSNAFTVNYGNVASNTESDLVGITFPDKPEYTSAINNLSIRGIEIFNRNGRLNYKNVINFLCDRDFGETEAFIVQCKTNWNDNAQIPMLWDMIYASRGFTNTNISVGSNNYQISALKRFSYSFVTVPSNTRSKYKNNSMSVKRVTNISGGNYWGKPTEPSIAASLKDFFVRNCANCTTGLGVRRNLEQNIVELSTTYNYFRLI